MGTRIRNFVQKLCGRPRHPSVLKVKAPDMPESRPITNSPIKDKSDIVFSVRKHEDGQYSMEIKQLPSEDKELDNYAKWLAGSMGRSMMKFDELVSVLDPCGVCKKTRLS